MQVHEGGIQGGIGKPRGFGDGDEARDEAGGGGVVGVEGGEGVEGGGGFDYGETLGVVA